MAEICICCVLFSALIFDCQEIICFLGAATINKLFIWEKIFGTYVNFNAKAYIDTYK